MKDYDYIKVTHLKSKGECLNIGKQGENFARKVIFDYSFWKKEYGEGVVTLFVKRPDEDLAYPVLLEDDGEGNAVWNISSIDTEYSGKGNVELRYSIDDRIVKSLTWGTIVYDSISASSEEAPPDPYENWVETLVRLGAEVQIYAKQAEDARDKAVDASSHYPKLGEDGHWYVWDVETEEYVDTGVVASGGGGGGTWSDLTDKPFDTIGENLKIVGRALTVDTAPNVQQDNTKPITSAAVYTQIGNINALLALI